MSLTTLAFGGFGLMALPIGVLADTIGERGALAILGGATSRGHPVVRGGERPRI